MKQFLLTTLTVTLSCAVFAFDAAAQPKRELMQDAHALVFQHASVKRSVEKLPNGVRTTTTTTDSKVLPVLRQHPRQMGDLYRTGGMVRGWDPLFRELAAVSDKVTMTVRDIDQGVEVVVTSDDAEVVKLIQAHADKVSDMAKRGVPAMHEPTALPPGYRRPQPAGKSPVGAAAENQIRPDFRTSSRRQCRSS